MKEEKEKSQWEEDETEELIIEDLTEIQGGIEDDPYVKPCGLGCFVSPPNGR